MGKHAVAVAALVALVVRSSVAFAQPAVGPSGHWEGTLQVPGQELKIEVDLTQTGGKWEGQISIPAQGMKAFPLSAITVQGDAIGFAMKGIPGDPQFTATLSKDGKALSGDFKQGGGTVPFTLARTEDAKIEPAPKSTPLTKELEGSWEGPLDVNGTVLRIVLKLSNQPNGTATGTLVSLDQGGAEVPITAIVQTGMHLKVLVLTVSGTYEGDLKDGQLSGTWTQGPASFPLVLKRTK
jgi:hypothetical protein